MEPGPEKLREETPPPPQAKRRRWWWRLYLGGIFGATFLFAFLTAPRDESLLFTSSRSIDHSVLTIPLLPIGLAFDFGGNLDAFFASGSGHAGPLVAVLELLTIPLAYYIFILHHKLTLKATTRRAFLLLMLSLILLITASLIGCEKLENRPIGIQ